MRPDSLTEGNIRLTPHWSDVFHLRYLVPAAVGVVLAAVAAIRGESVRGGLSAAAILLAITLLLLLVVEKKRRSASVELSGEWLFYSFGRSRRKLRLNGEERVEICRSPLLRLLGCVEMKVYSGVTKREWLSVRLPEKAAKAAVRAMVPCGAVTGRILPGRHSAAVCALTSERPVLLLIFSAYFTLFSGENRMMNDVSVLLLASATCEFLRCFAKHRGLSLIRMENGCLVTSGTWKSREIYIPEKGIAGAWFRRSPAHVLCGFGCLSLITSGGTEIPVACRVRGDEGREAALRLIGAQDRTCVELYQPDSLRKQYAALFAATVFAAFVSTLLAFRHNDAGSRALLCTAAAFHTAAALRGLVGMRCAGGFGLRLSASAVFSGGMRGCTAWQSFIRREHIAGIRVRSGLFMRMNGMCTAQPYTRGGRKAPECRCVSYESMNGLVSRFC